MPLQKLEHVRLPLWFATAFATGSPLRLPLLKGSSGRSEQLPRVLLCAQMGALRSIPGSLLRGLCRLAAAQRKLQWRGLRKGGASTSARLSQARVFHERRASTMAGLPRRRSPARAGLPQERCFHRGGVCTRAGLPQGLGFHNGGASTRTGLPQGRGFHNGGASAAAVLSQGWGFHKGGAHYVRKWFARAFAIAERTPRASRGGPGEHLGAQAGAPSHPGASSAGPRPPGGGTAQASSGERSGEAVPNAVANHSGKHTCSRFCSGKLFLQHPRIKIYC